ncbi:unnamed protein product [Sphagnum jensenii]|uniref:Uncharacterized protein n=1 Tax=Sphagnum jensenii TaxID=128206 RepID=A0ABP1BJM9_9BRYO
MSSPYTDVAKEAFMDCSQNYEAKWNSFGQQCGVSMHAATEEETDEEEEDNNCSWLDLEKPVVIENYEKVGHRGACTKVGRTT